MRMRPLFQTLLALAMLMVVAAPLRADATPGCDPAAAPGCGGCYCEACVCAMDPFCCTSAWDPICALRCTDQCGGCGAATPCGDGVCGAGEGCDTCPFDCGTCPAPCGDITVKGCCLDGKLAQCADGALQITDCGGACGWSLDSKSYVCGGGGPDPAGVYPLVCPDPGGGEDVVVEWPEICEDVTWKGCCKGTTLFWCDGVGLQSLECGNNPAPLNGCGWTGGPGGQYDCGGTGADPGGDWPLDCDPDLGEVIGPPPEDECTVGETIQVGCGGVSFSGCCTDGKDLVFCEGGKLLCALHCAQLPSPLNTCGWKQAGETGFYDCGGDGIDPSGQNPIFCPDWTPVEDVVADAPGEVTGPWSCPALPAGGCCEGTILHYCDDGNEATFDCAEMAADPVFGAYVYCGVDEATGATSCLKKEDPSPPDCTLVPEPSPEMAPDTVEPDDVTGDGETVDGAAPDAGPDLSADTPPGDDTASGDTGWTWPDLPTPKDTVADGSGGGGGGGGGGKGCAAGPGATAPGMLLLLLLLGVLRSVRVRS